MIVSFVLSIVLIQLCDAYLRFLSFRNQMMSDEIRVLWERLIAWGIFSFIIYFWLFEEMGIVAASYKIALLLGWIPYLAIFMGVVSNQLWQHVFIFGMSALWSFISHNWSNIIVALFLMDCDEGFVICVHAALYLLWFILLLPLEKHIFINLLPSKAFFDQRPVGIYIAVLPLVMMLGHVIRIADGVLWHSWEERISRLFLPVVFFFFYRYVLVLARRFFEKQRAIRRAQLMENQIASIEEYQAMMKSSRKKVIEMRDSLLNNYNELHELINSGKLMEAMEYIRGQEHLLDTTVIRSFSDSPIVNAAISIYLQRAKSLGIRVRQQVSMPVHPATDETDLAMILSNLLENAIQATGKERAEEREISFILRQNSNQFVLEMTNKCHTNLVLDDEGMPKTSREGHGTGMVSLRTFLKKYDGYVAFSQEDGWVKLFLYWEDRVPC